VSGEASLSFRINPETSLDLGLAVSRSVLIEPGLGSDTYSARLGATLELPLGEMIFLAAEASTTRSDPGALALGPTGPDPVALHVTVSAAL